MQVCIEKAKSGADTLILVINGKRYAIYSSHDPLRDGVRYFRQYEDKPGELCIFIGLGLAYHILPFEGIIGRRDGVKQIIVLEPDEGIYNAVKGCRSVQRLVQSRSFRLYVGDDVRPFIRGIKTRYEYLFYRSMQVMSYPPLENIFRISYNSLTVSIQEGLDELAADGLTIARFSRIWVNNYRRNSGAKKAMPVSALHAGFTGNALVTGAGPSLDYVLGKLAPLRNRLFIIAVDASVKPLLQRRIHPDLIVTVDPQDSVYYHFCGLRREDISDIPAVMSFLSYPGVFDLFAERYIFRTRHPLSVPRVGGNEDLINHRAVSSIAFELACRMGFTSIHLAGLDFSYPGFRAYARHSFFYEYAAAAGARFNTAETTEARLLRLRNVSGKINGSTEDADEGWDENGESGRVIPSASNLESYKAELEALIDEMKRRMGIAVFNWNPLGREIRGAAVEEEPDLSEGFSKTGKPGKEHRTFSVRAADILPEDERTSQLRITLALRYRLFKHAAGFDEASKFADIFLYKRFDWR